MEAMFGLAAAYEIISPKSDVIILKDYLGSLKHYQILRRKTSVELQPYISMMNLCLSSKSERGRLHGLITLCLLVDESSDELFNECAQAWISQLMRFATSVDVHPNLMRISLEIFIQILKRSGRFSEISRYIGTVVAAKLVHSLLRLAMKLDSHKQKSVKVAILRCLAIIIKEFPTSCSSCSASIESFLIESIIPDNCNTTIMFPLVKLFSCLPLLSLKGKQAEMWYTIFRRLIVTFHTLQDALLELAPLDHGPFNQYLIPSPPQFCSSNQFSMSFFLLRQLKLISAFLEEMLLVDYPKFLEPELLFQLLRRAFDADLALPNCGANAGQSAIKACVAPQIQKLCLQLLTLMLKTMRRDLYLFLPEIISYIIRILDATSADEHLILTELRCDSYSLLGVVCTIFGGASCIDKYATRFVPQILADIFPKNKNISLQCIVTKKRGKRASAASCLGNMGAPLSLAKSEYFVNSEIACSAITSLAMIFTAVGPLISPSIHKDVQAIIIILALELSSTSNKPFSSAKYRLAVYEALTVLVNTHHTSWCSPVGILLYILRASALNDTDNEIRTWCQRTLCSLQASIQPRSGSLHLEMPVSCQEMQKIKETVLRVHTTIIGYNDQDVEPTDESSILNSNYHTSENVSPRMAKITHLENEVPNYLDKSIHNEADVAGDISLCRDLSNGKIESVVESYNCLEKPRNEPNFLRNDSHLSEQDINMLCPDGEEEDDIDIKLIKDSFQLVFKEGVV